MPEVGLIERLEYARRTASPLRGLLAAQPNR